MIKRLLKCITNDILCLRNYNALNWLSTAHIFFILLSFDNVQYLLMIIGLIVPSSKSKQFKNGIPYDYSNPAAKKGDILKNDHANIVGAISEQ